MELSSIFFTIFYFWNKIEFYYSLRYFYRNNRYHSNQFRKPNHICQNINKLIPNHYAATNTRMCVPG